jgi:hypothetical protein
VPDLMDDLEDELRAMLARRAADVRPRVTGAELRALAEQRRSRWPARVAPLLAAAAVLVVAVVTFALLGDNSKHPRPLQPAGPGTGQTVSPKPSPSTPPTTAPPTPSTSPTTAGAPDPAFSSTAPPTASLGLPSAILTSTMPIAPNVSTSSGNSPISTTSPAGAKSGAPTG